ncbi:hypothetical protein Sjap_006050 [Stephania japonica]|uniref:Molybdopterin synthase catalytic subunit n=1 Tax=Stephania japonica TaxID=461633 RepID=A0AAP0K7L6_9MAGN
MADAQSLQISSDTESTPKTLTTADDAQPLQSSSDTNKTLIEILPANVPIDPSKYMGFVQSPKYGAIATFSGTTRDTFEGRSVVELRYEAYEAMAAREVESICESARSRWDVGSVAVAHRLGRVGVGEISVFVAVSSVHRGESLDACRYLIDEIKGSVPIWKKEVYGDGEVWKENMEFFEGVGRRRGCCCGTKVRVHVDVEQEKKNKNVISTLSRTTMLGHPQTYVASSCGLKIKKGLHLNK